MIKSFLLSLIIVTSFIGFGQNDPLSQKVSVNFNEIKLKDAFLVLEKKGINVAFSQFDALEKEINVNYTNKSIQYILNDLTREHGLEYEMIGNVITLYEKKKREKYTISGFIYDAETGETLIGCRIYEPIAKSGINTNQFGFFSLRLANYDESRKVIFTSIGYESITLMISPSDTTFNVSLEQKQLNTVVVNSEKDKTEQVEMSKINLTAAEIKSIPALGGETDVLKAITLLPGIKQGVDGASGFYVRGGGADQNLILLDGVPIYNPYHLWGFLSSFNAEAINDISITKGAFPARYGGRLSSVLDITMKEGNNQKWEKSITLGLLSTKASISGPLVKNKSSIMLTARRTYADLIVVPILSAIRKEKGFKRREGYNFTDLNLKLNYKLSKKDRLYFSGFLSRDKYYLVEEGTYNQDAFQINTESKRNQGWGNQIGSLRWNHLFGNKLFLNTTAYISSYKYYTSDYGKTSGTDGTAVIEKESSIDYTSLVTDIALKQDYQYFPSKKHIFRFGYGAIYHSFQPGVNSFFSKTGATTIDNNINNEAIGAGEFSVYAEDEFTLTKRLQMNLGVHGSGFYVQETFYPSIQPRLGMNYAITDRIALKAGYSQMTQFLHLLTSSGITQSSDLWVPVTDKVKPQNAEQYSIGTAFLIGEEYQVEIESYYKNMRNLIDYKNGASFLSTETSWEDKVEVGKGEAYGGEIFIRKTKGKLTGWLGYTLSWANRTFENINFGKTYPYRYDRRHDISVVANYRQNEKWSFNAAWVFYTGNAVTLPTYSYLNPGYSNQESYQYTFPDPTTFSVTIPAQIIQNSTTRNNYRLPAYHRLDLTATYRKEKKWGDWNLNIGITNVYNRLNPSYYNTREQKDEKTEQITTKYITYTLFPIMPTINYQINF